MKIFGIFRHWWLIVLIIMLLFIGDVCYVRFVTNRMTRACGGRTISAGVIRSNITVFAIAVNNKPVYMETDSDNDGKIDYITHCENGLEKYTTHMDKAGNVKNRAVIYYSNHSNKADKCILYDVGETGVFTQRMWESPEGKQTVKEVLVEGHWIPVSGQGSHGPSRPATTSINMSTITKVVQ